MAEPDAPTPPADLPGGDEPPEGGASARSAPAFDLQKTWNWLVANARQMGRDLVEQALLLYFGYQQPDLPFWARARIAGALLYVISPIDLIPDLLPGGLLDDLAILNLALRSVQRYLSDDTRAKARAQLVKWFGEG